MKIAKGTKDERTPRGQRGGAAAWVQLSGDETQWVLQQLQGLGEKKKIAQRIWAWPLDIPDQTVATSALTDLAVAVRPDASRNSSRIAAWTSSKPTLSSSPCLALPC